MFKVKNIFLYLNFLLFQNLLFTNKNNNNNFIIFSNYYYSSKLFKESGLDIPYLLERTYNLIKKKLNISNFYKDFLFQNRKKLLSFIEQSIKFNNFDNDESYNVIVLKNNNKKNQKYMHVTDPHGSYDQIFKIMYALENNINLINTGDFIDRDIDGYGSIINCIVIIAIQDFLYNNQNLENGFIASCLGNHESIETSSQYGIQFWEKLIELTKDKESPKKLINSMKLILPHNIIIVNSKQKIIIDANHSAGLEFINSIVEKYKLENGIEIIKSNIANKELENKKIYENSILKNISNYYPISEKQKNKITKIINTYIRFYKYLKYLSSENTFYSLWTDAKEKNEYNQGRISLNYKDPNIIRIILFSKYLALKIFNSNSISKYKIIRLIGHENGYIKNFYSKGFLKPLLVRKNNFKESLSSKNINEDLNNLFIATIITNLCPFGNIYENTINEAIKNNVFQFEIKEDSCLQIKYKKL
jgi:hypothetical protein